MGGSILVIESVSALGQDIALPLLEAGFEVVNVPDYLQGLFKLEGSKPEMVVLDEELPILDGWEACSEVHRALNVSVVMLGRDSGGSARMKVVEAEQTLTSELGTLQ